MELRRVRGPHHHGDPRRAARLAALPRRLSGWRVAAPGRNAGQPRDPAGAGHSRGRPDLLQRALPPRACRALAWAAAGRGQVLRVGHRQPQRARLRARPFRARHPPLGRETPRSPRRPGPRARKGDRMSAKTVTALRPAVPPDMLDALRRQYGGSVELAGNADGLYERHLLFDNVSDPEATTSREHYEAVARSVRDILSQRWIRTENTYARVNPKRIYYLSMEFLIGRALANNVTNLFLDAIVKQAADENGLDWPGLLHQDPWEVRRPHERVRV